MRTPAVLGASLLLLASLSVAGPASASPSGHWEGVDDARNGAAWDGGSAAVDGTTYDWPADTRSWDGSVCPDMDVAKTDTTGDPLTVDLVAPEGKLISAYCIKSGSERQGEGPKIVVLDEPVATLTIAYPTTTQGDKDVCKAISHYAVAYVDAPTEPGTPEEPVAPGEPGTPEQPATPDEETPTEPGAPEQPETTDESGTPEESTPSESAAVVDVPADDENAGVGGADYDEQASGTDAVETRAQTGTVSSGRVGAEAAVAAAPQSLPVTGAQVLGLVMAAVALLGAGAGALIWARQRRAS